MLGNSSSPSTTHTTKIGGSACFGLFALVASLGFWLMGCETTLSSHGAAPFERLLDSVVRIDVREASISAGSKRYSMGVGSGVILSEDGLILTNAHVVSPKAEDIWVTLANLERVKAELLGWDHWTDLALLRLDMGAAKERELSFSYAVFGDSKELQPGQIVYAVGTPHGLSRTVTKGIVSNTKRYFLDATGIRGYETGYFNNWLQTDAAINPGNSGGPLVDERGFVVGINTRTYMGAENLGFAIPEWTARFVMSELLEQGQVERSYIGVVPGFLQDMENFFEMEANQGMLINSVDPGAPASEAGLRPGDIVLSINGRMLDGRFPEQIPPIRNFIASFPVGATLSLEVRRNGVVERMEVRTERLLSRVGEEWAFDSWGLSVREVSRAYARENQLDTEDGVIVVGTQPAFPADEAGLQRGEIILKVNREPLVGIDDLKDVYAGFEKEPESILMETQRNRRALYKVLKP